jgi:hypothetical protein
VEYHHNNHEHNQGLDLKTSFFKVQGILRLSIFVLARDDKPVARDFLGTRQSLLSHFFPTNLAFYEEYVAYM